MDALQRPFLIDVSRLIWRSWARRLPTGIDRVCLAYVQHYSDRAQAVIRRRGHQLVLSPKHSKRLFSLLREGGPASRAKLVLTVAAALPAALRIKVRPGTFYFNVGHTGLNESGLPAWIAKNKVRAVYMVHDLIPLTHPQFCRAGEAQKHECRISNMLESATGIIGNSKATLAELASFAATRGMPMPASVAAWISGPAPSTRSPKQMLGTPYFVILGTIEGRKNHLLLLDIWRELVRDMGSKAPTLIVIGQRGWEAERALAMLEQASEFDGKVIELNRCCDDELASWISGARAMLMPSFTEGFGLPVIEAIERRCPVICSDLPVFREIGGTIPTFVDSSQPDQWDRWIRSFIDDDPERSRQMTEMNAFRAPDWKDHFTIVDRWIQTL